MGHGRDILSDLAATQTLDEYRQEHWEGSFADYLDIVRERPEVTRTAYQRLYDMIMSYGTYDIGSAKEGLIRYRFFDDPDGDGRDAIFGLTRPLMEFVNVLKSAALGYGTERRVILLHGPVGSSKSTIARLLKRGLERYSRTDEGALYTFGWTEADGSVTWDPMNGDPLQLVPASDRAAMLKRLNEGLDEDAPAVRVKGEVCPLSRYVFGERLRQAGGDWTVVVESVVVKRFVLSEPDRIGIGTFQPKDEKNQDSTELTGDINFRKIAEYGSESDPRAFNFDGEFNVANRGMIEFIEVLKLDVAFLYDLLGASQEHKIKPKKFAQTDIDTVIIGHTNEPEYKKLQ
ncbi:MAG: serine protein kinase, partial [Planctomycetota bacterium]